MKNPIYVKRRDGIRKIKNNENIEFLLSQQIHESVMQEDLIKRFKEGDTSPDVISYIASDKIYNRMFLTNSQIQEINKKENWNNTIYDKIFLIINDKIVLVKIV